MRKLIRRVAAPVMPAAPAAVALLALLALVAPPLARPAPAQVVETREDDANPMVSVFKSTVYGSAAGTLLGLAFAVADEGGDNGDAVRWGFVTGTFFGFAYGIYHVSTRPRAGAFLEGGAGGWNVAPPDLHVTRSGAGVRLLTYRF